MWAAAETGGSTRRVRVGKRGGAVRYGSRRSVSEDSSRGDGIRRFKASYKLTAVQREFGSATFLERRGIQWLVARGRKQKSWLELYRGRKGPMTGSYDYRLVALSVVMA